MAQAVLIILAVILVFIKDSIGSYRPIILLNNSPKLIEDYYQWKAPKRTRSDLYCPLLCQHYDRTDNYGLSGFTEVTCCNCYNVPYWEFAQNETSYLKVEYRTRRGHAELLLYDNQDFPYQIVEHIDGELTNIPENKCRFDRTVKMDLSGNFITEVGDITCLKMLDTINLSRNRITFISNDSFASLTYLRDVDFSYNEIRRIQVNTLSRPEIGLFQGYFNNNEMKTIDVSNFIIEKSFCYITFQYNKLIEIVNDQNLTLATNKTYGRGGFVSFRNNKFRTFPDFKKLGVDDLTLLGKIIHYGFDFRGNPWNCDGHMVPYLMLQTDVVRLLFRDYMNLICHDPPSFKNRNLANLVRNNSLDNFFTLLTRKEGCPARCVCKEQPSRFRTFVNCSHKKLTELPKDMPKSKHLEIDLSFNNIQTPSPQEYLSRTTKLNLRGNTITDLPEEFLQSLNSSRSESVALEFDSIQNIKSLNQNFQHMNSCSVQFGNLTIDCGCKDAWIGGWLKSRKCDVSEQRGEITCINSKLGRFPAGDITESMVCDPDNSLYRILSIVFSVLILLTVGIASSTYTFRYELYVFSKRYQAWKVDTMHMLKYDAYISMNDNNEQLRIWACQTFIPVLRKSGYTIYCPCQNAEVGCSMDLEVIEKMNSCRHVIILLSSDYFAPNADNNDYLLTTLEWRYAWNLFRHSGLLRLTIINYDQMRAVDIQNRQLKAFVRMRETLDFSNRNHTFFDEVKHRLGAPWRSTGLKNAKPRFSTDSRTSF